MFDAQLFDLSFPIAEVGSHLRYCLLTRGTIKMNASDPVDFKTRLRIFR
jgi:hypothetical protein